MISKIILFLLLVWYLLSIVIHSKEGQNALNKDIPKGKKLNTKLLYLIFPSPIIPFIIVIVYIMTVIIN